MTKRILFYMCMVFTAILIISTINTISVILGLIGVAGMWTITCNMTDDEINSLFGGEWLNKKFNTKHFTEEE